MPKTTKPLRTARRARMTAAKAAGVPTAAIAKTEGVSRGWASQELASDESRQILAGLVQQDMATVRDLFAATLRTIGEAMKAEKVVWANGGAARLGADHYARLTACKRLLELVTLGRPPAKPAEDEGKARLLTLAELEEIVKAGKLAVQ
jgi:hypothetical protein